MKVELFATVEQVGREDRGNTSAYTATMMCASRGPGVVAGSILHIDALSVELARALGATIGFGELVRVTIEVDKT